MHIRTASGEERYGSGSYPGRPFIPDAFSLYISIEHRPHAKRRSLSTLKLECNVISTACEPCIGDDELVWRKELKWLLEWVAVVVNTTIMSWTYQRDVQSNNYAKYIRSHQYIIAMDMLIPPYVSFCSSSSPGRNIALFVPSTNPMHFGNPNTSLNIALRSSSLSQSINALSSSYKTSYRAFPRCLSHD